MIHVWYTYDTHMNSRTVTVHTGPELTPARQYSNIELGGRWERGKGANGRSGVRGKSRGRMDIFKIHRMKSPKNYWEYCWEDHKKEEWVQLHCCGFSVPLMCAPPCSDQAHACQVAAGARGAESLIQSSGRSKRELLELGQYLQLLFMVPSPQHAPS